MSAFIEKNSDIANDKNKVPTVFGFIIVAIIVITIVFLVGKFMKIW